MTSGLDRRDLPWITGVAASFAFGLVVSWQQWGSPLVDRGREMNQPLRLAGGEMLYSDVRHIYGPLSPYLHAELFRQFGASLDILYADGIITAVIILALVYWLARQLMGPAAAAIATANVTWLCVFRQVGGNYILPYSYGAVHGAAFGLGTLVLLVASLRDGLQPARSAPAAQDTGRLEPRSRRHYFLLAGVCAGLATLAKTEMGLPALAAGITAAVLVAYPDVRRGSTLVGYFLASALTLIVAVYGFFAVRVGWHTLLVESWLIPMSLPPELVYFNKRISGLDRPVSSLWEMFGATVKLGIMAAMIAATSLVIARISRLWQTSRVPVQERFTDGGRVQPRPLWPFLAASLAILLLLPIALAVDWGEGFAESSALPLKEIGIPLATRLDWGAGRYLAMPLVLAGLLIALLVRFWRADATASARNHTVALIVCAVYALGSLPRIILRVHTDDSYSSYLLPVSVVMFTYCWVQPFAATFTDGRTRRLARNIVLGLILADVTVAAGAVARQFRDRATVPISTLRGTFVAASDLGRAWNEALAYIERHTTVADAIAVLPEGTSVNFFSGRRNPLREEIITPGFLDEAGEARAIRQLRAADTRLILITNRPTLEFSAAVFGRDYNRLLMRWIEEHYEPVAMFGPDKSPGLEIGHPTFFIRAYHRKPDN